MTYGALPAPPPLRPLKGLRLWLFKRLPRTATLRLTQHNLYILPTGAGWMLALTLLLLLVSSINFQLNLGYLLTFLLTGCAAVSVLVTHNNLRGLQLQAAPLTSVFAGQNASIPVRLHAPHRRKHYTIGLQWLPTSKLHDTALPGDVVWANVSAHDSTTVHLPCPPWPRGRWPHPAIQAQSRYPLGIFRTWCWWHPAADILVYPQPEPNPPPLPLGFTPEGNQPPAQPWSAPTPGQPDGVRPYRRGDPLKRLLWKKIARHADAPPEQWVSRDTPPPHISPDLWLDAQHCGLSDPEARYSRLCAWVLQAELMGLTYGLRLPGTELPPALGAAHQQHCLEALACC